MESRWARVARGVSAAGFATFVATFSHTLAGGSGASPFGVAVSFVISAMVCTMLTGRGLSLWRLTVSIGLSQFLFHALFSGLGTPVVAEHSMQSMDIAAPHLHDSSTMWLAHAAAALVTVAAFRFGEQAFWGVVNTARLLVARLLVVTAPVLDVPRPVVTVERRFVPRDLTLLLSSMRHRGPPVEFPA
jgi:hypothetical protein